MQDPPGYPSSTLPSLIRLSPLSPLPLPQTLQHSQSRTGAKLAASSSYPRVKWGNKEALEISALALACQSQFPSPPHTKASQTVARKRVGPYFQFLAKKCLPNFERVESASRTGFCPEDWSGSLQSTLFLQFRQLGSFRQLPSPSGRYCISLRTISRPPTAMAPCPPISVTAEPSCGWSSVQLFDRGDIWSR